MKELDYFKKIFLGRKQKMFKKYLFQLSLILVLLCVGATMFSFADTPITFGTVTASPSMEIEELVPPSIMPVFFLSGSDYEMGYQYGRQAGPYVILLRNKIEIAYRRKDIWEERYEVLQGFQYFLDEHAPYLVEYFKGMADGVTDAGYPMSYADALMLQGEWDIAATTSDEPAYPSEVPELPYSDACSGWAAWGDSSADGQLYCGMSADGEWGHQANVVAFPETGNSYVADGVMGYLGIGWYMNSEGVTIGLTAQGTRRPIDTQFGLTWPILMTHVARTANSAAEARDMFLTLKSTRGTGYLIADATEGFVVEVTSSETVARAAGDYGETDFVVVTNHFVDPHMFELSGQAERPRNTYDRYDTIFRLINNYRRVDADFGKLIYSTFPVLKDNRNVRIGVPAQLLTYTSCGPAHQSFVGNRNLFADPSHTFYEIELKDTPAQVVAAAYSTTRSYLKMAQREIGKIGYNDVKYALLNDIYIRAKEAYARGINYDRSARVDTGNEALFKFSKSMSNFVEAQARAMQVYKALVPPALTP